MVKVSVIMISYNQESFIKQAILGVLAQKTYFEIELILADDCSQDNTESIVQEIIKSKPDNNIIRYTRHQSNQGMMPNFMWALKQCKGQYIALCEGDDYWTNPGKLQKQVDFLEANPDFAICFSLVDELYPDGALKSDSLSHRPLKGETDLIDLIENGNYIHTPSVMFVNCLSSMPNFFSKLSVGDYPLYLLLAEHGKIKFLPEVTAVYRRGVGMWSSLSSQKQLLGWLDMSIYMIDYFKHNAKARNALIKKYENNSKSLTKNAIEAKAPFSTIIHYIFMSYRYRKYQQYHYSKEVLYRTIKSSNYRISFIQFINAFIYQFYPSTSKRKYVA